MSSARETSETATPKPVQKKVHFSENALGYGEFVSNDRVYRAQSATSVSSVSPVRKAMPYRLPAEQHPPRTLDDTGDFIDPSNQILLAMPVMPRDDADSVPLPPNDDVLPEELAAYALSGNEGLPRTSPTDESLPDAIPPKAASPLPAEHAPNDTASDSVPLPAASVSLAVDSEPRADDEPLALADFGEFVAPLIQPVPLQAVAQKVGAVNAAEHESPHGIPSATALTDTPHDEPLSAAAIPPESAPVLTAPEPESPATADEVVDADAESLAVAAESSPADTDAESSVVGTESLATADEVVGADAESLAVATESSAIALESSVDIDAESSGVTDELIDVGTKSSAIESFAVATESSPASAEPSPAATKSAREALRREKKERKQQQAREKAQAAQATKAALQAQRIRRPIGAKLIGIISVLMVIALAGVTYIVSYFITQDIRSSAEENNLAINSRTASDTENRINNTVSSVGMFLDLLKTAGENATEVRAMENMFFERNKDVVAVYLPGSEQLFASTSFLVSRELQRDTIVAYMRQETESIEKARNGSFELLNASPFFDMPALVMFYPIAFSARDNAVGILYSTDEIGESFSAGTVNQSFFVNNDGLVLVHGDLLLMMTGADESGSAIVKTMQESVVNNSQIGYRDDDGEEYIGAFRKLSIGNGAVITTVKTSIVLEGIQATTRRNIYITMAILSFAIMVIYFFAKSLSVPLKQLTAIVNEINSGNFNTELFNDLKIHRKDEIGILAQSTRNEREILNMVTRLTNKGVTKAIITKEIDFDPHLKDVTIFFSDIRGFTAISDGFKNRFGEKSAAEIINFLNDYMSRMVTCINQTGGIVDKFEGDAIMAAWGTLRNNSLDWEKMPMDSVTRQIQQEAHDKYVREDALSAITCCVAMRYSLMKYNKDAAAFTEAHKHEPEAQYKPHIQIGAGLNSGRATVGFMGSFDKMEFTSIGDAVNFASRTEASNKPCGTDILITQDTLDLLKKDYIRCAENDFTLAPENERHEILVEQIPVEFEVKGKGKQHFYGVVNMPHFDIVSFFSSADPAFEVDADCEKAVGPKGPKTLSEMRALLGIDEPDFGQVNLDAEENKIQVAAP